MSRLRAVFPGAGQLDAARRALQEAHLKEEELFAPVPVEVGGVPVSPVRRFVLAGGIAGGIAAFALTVGTARALPLVVSGKPVVSLPPFLVIVFELTILLAALSGLAGFLYGATLPSTRARNGYTGSFARDAFGLVVACPRERMDEVRGLMIDAGAAEVVQLGEEPPAETVQGGSATRPSTPAILLFSCLTAAATGCNVSLKMPTDMIETPAVHHDEELRLPAEGTLHRGGEVQTNRFRAAVTLQNPLPPDDGHLARGERLFAIYCAPCHGATGAGDGPVAQYYGDRPPTDLTSQRVRNQLDGFIYATIRNGGGNMPPHGHAIGPDERWAIVLFVRDLQERQP